MNTSQTIMRMKFVPSVKSNPMPVYNNHQEICIPFLQENCSSTVCLFVCFLATIVCSPLGWCTYEYVTKH